MKKFIAFVLAVFVIASCAISASAAVVDPGDSIQPYWAYMNVVQPDMSFSGTTGTATVTVSRIFGVTTLLEGTLTVYKQSGNDWIYVDSTEGSSTRSLNLTLPFQAVKGATYKAVLDVTAYSSTDSESDTVSKIEMYS